MTNGAAVTDGRVLGHEAIGTVTEAGRATRRVAIGDRVVASRITSCGACRYCRRRSRRAVSLMVETTVHAALDRYGDRLTRVEAHLGDEDGNVGEHRRGRRCLLEARPSEMDPVVVTGSADTAEGTRHDAARKMQSLLDRTFGRIDSRDADTTIRQGRP